MSGWLEQQYTARGRPERSLELSRRRSDRYPTRDTYTAVETAVRLPDQPDAPWPTLRPQLLATLRKHGNWHALIDIHLAAGEVGDALAALRQAERNGRAVFAGWGTTAGSPAARVAAAAEAKFPDEAIDLYRRLADREITVRNRSAYHDAAAYLARVRQVLIATSRRDEWLALIDDLRQEHTKLRALQDELKQAGLE